MTTHYSVDMEPAVLASSARILPEQAAWVGRIVAGTYATDADDLRDLLAMLDIDPAEAKAWGRRGKPDLLGSTPEGTPQMATRTRTTGIERQEMMARVRDDYAAGKSIRAIAAELGRSYGFVHQLLTEAGAELRPRGRRGGRR